MSFKDRQKDLINKELVPLLTMYYIVIPGGIGGSTQGRMIPVWRTRGLIREIKIIQYNNCFLSHLKRTPNLNIKKVWTLSSTLLQQEIWSKTTLTIFTMWNISSVIYYCTYPTYCIKMHIIWRPKQFSGFIFYVLHQPNPINNYAGERI